MTLKPARDVWKLVWRVVIGFNVILAVVFLAFIILSLLKLNVGGLGEFAIVTSFWLLPFLLIMDLAVLAAYILLKRPKGHELSGPVVWVASTGLGAFVLIVVYVGLASVS